jgi:transposase-like protein
MTRPIARDPIYRRRRFEAEIIELCVRWYITYRLSYRDLVAMRAERGLPLSHTTILRWVLRYARRARAEPSSAAASAPGGSEVEVCSRQELPLPERHR